MRAATRVIAMTAVAGLTLLAVVPSAEARSADKKHDQKLAQSLVLKASDVPAGWTRKPKTKNKKDSVDTQLNKMAVKCGAPRQAFDAFKKFETAKATGDFESPDNSELSAEPTIFNTKRNADRAWNLVNDCLLDGFIKILDDSITKGGSAATAGATFDVGPSARLDSTVRGVATKGRTQTITVSAQGIQIPLSFTFVFLHHGRVDETVLLLSYNNELTPTFQNQVLTTLARRTTAA